MYVQDVVQVVQFAPETLDHVRVNWQPGQGSSSTQFRVPAHEVCSAAGARLAAVRGMAEKAHAATKRDFIVM